MLLLTFKCHTLAAVLICSCAVQNVSTFHPVCGGTSTYFCTYPASVVPASYPITPEHTLVPPVADAAEGLGQAEEASAAASGAAAAVAARRHAARSRCSFRTAWLLQMLLLGVYVSDKMVSSFSFSCVCVCVFFL